ncbi:alpha-amylase family glycosyl hydrolase [Corallococcus sp. BB11-1]|uniref:alpha amylase C-terminal domain-containing protein n=1 Tax=Corallococcus sp. BB11-1 TaxID=2996783 RepID=UPI00226E1B30|nr:alpha-amylase family glycosyl hydrolase [Corallococcus sp. BB11-1]MCY1034446.1 alpha-amylase family glycosyl hydrolase [Corallococcus sp. BB11-1]
MSDSKINRPTRAQAPATASTTVDADKVLAQQKAAAARAAAARRNTSAFEATPTASAKGPVAGSGTLARSGNTEALLGASPTAPVRPGASVEKPVTRTITFTYDAGPHNQLTHPKLKGSWDADGRFSAQWSGGGIPMKPLGNGKYEATVKVADDGLARNWEWGVSVDGPSGKDQWAVMGEGNLKLDLSKPTASYSPTTYHQMGAQRSGQDVSFKFWAPDARAVQVKVTDKQGQQQRIPLTRDEGGNWTAQAKGAWSQLEGKSYVYEVVDSTGATSDRPDPYARRMMGEQRGLDRLFLDPMRGQEVNRYFPGATELMRFDVDDAEDADSAYLVLKDGDGNPLDKAQLQERLGTFDETLVDKLRGGAANSDFWSRNVTDDGRIKMKNQGGAWTALVNDPSKLEGLRYEFQVFDKDAQGKLHLRDDVNSDGKLSQAERIASSENDPWSDLITVGSGVDFRGSIFTDPTTFQFKNDNVPREKDPSKWTVYQLHAGSFLGQAGNANRSTMEDLLKKLDYFKELGVTTLELLPTNEVEGSRNWGYLGVNSLAAESSLGFEDDTGQWVEGDEALKRFIDAAHGKGLNVVSDVVYNHVFGDHNGLWNVGGPSNPYFNWSKEPGKFEQRDTAWGAVPAYNTPQVKQLFIDHAVQQVQELKFDGLRFDFTEPIKGTGGKDGWEMLREINRQVHFVNPDVWTVAEQFDYDPSISRPAQADGTGGGFDAQWYTEFQHRLVNDNSKPGLVQAAARGLKTDMDAFVNLMTAPRGLDSWQKALSIISNHDEVGNAQRTMNTAEGENATDFPDQWTRGAARFTGGMGMAGPGIPMFFQGDEFGAQNDFRWGNPSTWDSDWSWQDVGKGVDFGKVTFNDATKATYERLFTLSPDAQAKDAAYKAFSADDRKLFKEISSLPASERKDAMLDVTRRQSFNFYKDAIGLRNSSPAFSAAAEVKRVYTHNDDSVLAFTRKSGNEEFLVVGSLNKKNLDGYTLPLPPGQWKEVLNSDAGAYGGGNFGNFGATLNGGNTKVNIPAAGYVVMKRVG